MTGIEMRVEHRRFYRACAAGLSEKTAVADIEITGLVVNDPSADTRLRAGASALNEGEPLYGVAEADWPAAFLIPGIDDVNQVMTNA